MSVPAWYALADRFAALATEQEFRFTTHPFNSPAAFQDGPERFRLAHPFGGSPEAPESVGIVLGQGLFQRGEFVRANRLRWLSWAAGLLFDPGSCAPPEPNWWRHLRETHQDRIEADAGGGSATLHDLSRQSAAAARSLAASNRLTPPSAGETASNWPKIQAALRPLRERFNAARWHTARPDAALVAFPDPAAFELWERRAIDATAPDSTNPRAWAKHGTVWGDPEQVEAFGNLAKDAGTALPIELTFAPPLFPWFNPLSNMRPAPQTWWLEFLYLVCPTVFTVQHDTPVPTSRVARLTTSAFTTSVQVIDRLLSLDGPAFLREFRVNVVRANPWLNQSDQDAALLAVEASAARKTTPAVVPSQPPHWTDYPERIKTFGELLSILETLDRHEMESGFTAPDFDKERGRVTAYTVDFHNRRHQFHPRLDQMPGLERLLDRFDIDGYPTLTQSQARELRRHAARALNRDSASLNALRFTEIADALDALAPGSTPPTPSPSPPNPATIHPPQPRSAARRVNTRPESVEPPHHYVEAAMRALPGVLNNTPAPSGVHDSAGRRGAGYALLRQRLEAAPFNRDAVEWAIHRHVEAGRLEVSPGRTATPGIVDGGEWVVQPVTGHTYDRERCVLWAQPALWEWWNAIESGQPVNGASMSANPTTPREAHVAEQPHAGYTMQDIRELLRYKREVAEFEAWRRRTFKPVLKMEEYGSRVAAMAFNTPQPRRLSEEVANTSAVYRRLLRESLTVLNKELDEPALLYFVGEAADRHKRRIEEVWLLTTNEFGRMMDEPAKPAASTTPPTEVAPKADGNGPQEPHVAVQERKLTERQKLILTEMLAMRAVGSAKRTTRNEVVQRIDKKKAGADFARDFGALKEANYTDSDAGPDGGVWLTGKGKTKAEELNKENNQ